MGSARSILFTVSSALMIFAGAGSIACAAILDAQILASPSASFSSIFFHAALTLIYSIINIVSGINGLRCHNRRINSAVVIRLPEISVILCLVCIILTLFQGTLFGYILILAGTGVLIPILFIFAAVKKSYM